ncbi:MAG: glycosyltransferase [Methanobrevibacter sp.]|nr:glycosyltransferase [Methanobrevibacter sp.]MBE6489640.1 glycosyltransferase [Methanobrevibacter sp.]
MISIIILIQNSENYLYETISDILQNNLDAEIICVMNGYDEEYISKLNNFEGKIKIIVNNVKNEKYVSKNIALDNANGDYILFLESDQKINCFYLENLLKTFKFNDLDFLISDAKFNNSMLNYNECLLSREINYESLFELLKYDYFLICKTSLLKENNIKFFNNNYFKNNELFFLNCLFYSKKLFVSEGLLISNDVYHNQEGYSLNFDMFYHVAEKVISDYDFYFKFKGILWNLIFKNLFYFINDIMKYAPAKRKYFADLKSLFEYFCYEKRFYEDILNTLDAQTFEFYNQNVPDVCYTPKKNEILHNLINENFEKLNVAIKSPHNDLTWGDYFFANSLKKSFEKKGFNVEVQGANKWYSNDFQEDIVIVLRGLTYYVPKKDNINIMWNISHPDAIKLKEYELYDIVFIASNKYASIVDNNVRTVVKPLLQCTDPDVFYHKFNQDCADEILFVGKTRHVFREIIKDITSTSWDVSVYGEGWAEFIDKHYIKGEFIDNDVLNQFYSSCKILLNDHWEEMRELDFPSNRLFDALACAAFIISDDINSAHTLFDDNVVTYESVEDLNEKIEFYLNNDFERDKKRKEGQKIVLSKHTFDLRVEEIIETLKCLSLD